MLKAALRARPRFVRRMSKKVRSSSARASRGLFGVDLSAQGGFHRIQVRSPIRVVLTGVLFGARFSWNWICDASMLVSLGSVLHARRRHAFRGSDKAAAFCQSLSISFGNRERRSGFGRVNRSSLASRLNTVPTGECPAFLGRLGNWCAAASSSTATSECKSLIRSSSVGTWPSDFAASG
jgi:hypothetical protein